MLLHSKIVGLSIMFEEESPEIISNRYRLNSSKRATLVSISSNCLMALIKGGIGLWIGSLSLIADSVDSSLDLVSSITSYLGVRFSSKPPDEEHPFGHGKHEMVLTIGISLILFISSGWIVHGALDRLASKKLLEFHLLGLVTAAVGIIWKLALFRYLIRVGRRTRSTIIIADAYNNRTDSVSTLGVLFVMIGLYFGISWLDPVIAIGITLIIIYTGISISKSALATLLDVRPSRAVLDKIQSIAISIENIQKIHKLRARQMGGYILADVHILVNKGLTIEQGHQIAEEFEKKVKAETNVQELLIHIEPID